MIENKGYLRMFLIIGELLGAIFYFFTVSIVVIKSANIIINIVRKIILFVYKVTLRPLVKICQYFMRKLRGLFIKNKNKIEIMIQKHKIHLK